MDRGTHMLNLKQARKHIFLGLMGVSGSQGEMKETGKEV